MAQTKEKLLLGVPDVASQIGVDPRTLRKAIDAKEVPGVRVGRYVKIPLWWVKQQRDGIAPAAG